MSGAHYQSRLFRPNEPAEDERVFHFGMQVLRGRDMESVGKIPDEWSNAKAVSVQLVRSAFPHADAQDMPDRKFFGMLHPIVFPIKEANQGR
jgi:hypothetical protein